MRFAEHRFWLVVGLAGFCSMRLCAVCPENDPPFSQAVAEGHYDNALQQVVRDLRLNKNEASSLHIVPGLQQTNDSRLAEADPDKNVINLDPQLFLEGMPGVCQAVSHELQHLRQFRSDRQQLHAYYQSPPASYRNAWDGCDVSALSQAPDQLEQSAFDCLEDDKLKTHTAVFEIDGVLHQVPYATFGLRDEDRDYLLEHLQLFSNNIAQWLNSSNEAYYLPSVKRKDRGVFCQGVRYAQQQRWDVAILLQTYTTFCGRR